MWDWGIAAFVVAIVALGVALVALPTAFQMFWGRPTLSVEFAQDDLDNGARRLRIYISNAPIHSRWLRRMGVTRTPTEIWGDYSIYEWGSNRLIQHLNRPNISTDKETGLQVTLAHTVAPARFTPIVHGKDGAFLLAKNNSNHDFPISAGKYYMDLDITTSVQTYYNKRAEFIIGDRPKNSFWLLS